MKQVLRQRYNIRTNTMRSISTGTQLSRGSHLLEICIANHKIIQEVTRRDIIPRPNHTITTNSPPQAARNAPPTKRPNLLPLTLPTVITTMAQHATPPRRPRRPAAILGNHMINLPVMQRVRRGDEEI